MRDLCVQGIVKEVLVNPEKAIIFLQQSCSSPFKNFLTMSFGHEAEHKDCFPTKMFLYYYS